MEESHAEWKTEKAAYDAMKDHHDKEVQEHSEALLKHNQLMAQEQLEMNAAEQFEQILGEEIDMMGNDNDYDDNHKEGSSTLADDGAREQWELDVLKTLFT